MRNAMNGLWNATLSQARSVHTSVRTGARRSPHGDEPVHSPKHRNQHAGATTRANYVEIGGLPGGWRAEEEQEWSWARSTKSTSSPVRSVSVESNAERITTHHQTSAWHVTD